jgi:hypothetical protein
MAILERTRKVVGKYYGGSYRQRGAREKRYLQRSSRLSRSGAYAPPVVWPNPSNDKVAAARLFPPSA